jgi:hypothetical protein
LQASTKAERLQNQTNSQLQNDFDELNRQHQKETSALNEEIVRLREEILNMKTHNRA